MNGYAGYSRMMSSRPASSPSPVRAVSPADECCTLRWANAILVARNAEIEAQSALAEADEDTRRELGRLLDVA